MKNKIKINTITGITDIIMAIITFLAPMMIVGSAFDESFSNGSQQGQTSSLAIGLIVLGVISLILHIVAFVKSRKANISNVGNILGIIAAALFAGIGAIMGFPAMVLYILAAIFTLRQKNLQK